MKILSTQNAIAVEQAKLDVIKLALLHDFSRVSSRFDLVWLHHQSLRHVPHFVMAQINVTE
jgi:hypothetical protein